MSGTDLDPCYVRSISGLARQTRRSLRGEPSRGRTGWRPSSFPLAFADRNLLYSRIRLQ
jgi:hypothetical protein